MNINDVKTLKAKRAARKGSIKRLEKHLDKLAGVTLARLHLTDMERKMAVLQENIQAYDFVQERISQVALPNSWKPKKQMRWSNVVTMRSCRKHTKYSSMPVRLGTIATRYRNYPRAIRQRRCHRDLRTQGL